MLVGELLANTAIRGPAAVAVDKLVSAEHINRICIAMLGEGTV
jgi:hypothetical protein